MYISRKLLYHRGVDDQVGTYVTDYIEAAFCFAFGTHLLLQVCFSKSRESGNENDLTRENFKSPRNTTAVIIIQYSIATIALIGGLVHQFLQKVEPYETWKDDWTWLIVWRIASAFSAVMIFGFMFLGQQILTEEKVMLLSRRNFKLFWSFVTLTCVGVFVYCLGMIADPDDPWSVRVPFIISYLAAVANFIMVATAVYLRKRIRESPKKPNRVQDKNDGEPSTESNSKKTTEPNYRIDLILHASAPFIFVIAGAINYYLAQIGCASDETDGCPLPDYFNHNSLLHMMVIPAVFLYFLAELFAIKRRREGRNN